MPKKLYAPAFLLAVTLLCYWTPMTNGDTSIQWDAADQFQPTQNYISTELHQGRIPFWTPFPWAGYPLLADPQAGAWYPLNWPFFLVGVLPHTLVVEHWLHALLACLGAYFLALRLLRRTDAAVLTGLCYGLSGFFAGHSSHTVMLQCAAWMPWILLAFSRALESRPLRYIALGALAAGAMILGGHFQTILYGFLALGLFAVAYAVAAPKRWIAIFGTALAIAVMGTFLSAVATLPGLELTVNSVRTSLHAVDRTEGVIPPAALSTMMSPNFYGIFSGQYHGPEDITQFYFYAGFLLVPLAIAGLWTRAIRWPALLLVIPTIWYAMGQSAGLYLLIARLPGFSSVRAPVNIWFVPSLGLALLAGAGLQRVGERWKFKWLGPAVLLVFACDLFYWNSAANPLAYARQSYESLYGDKEDLVHRAGIDALPPLTRFDAPEHLPVFGPLSHYLDRRIETDYGYGPLMLSRYSDYVQAMRISPGLRRGLGISRSLDVQIGAIRAEADPVARASFPKELIAVHDGEESRQKLPTVDQTRQALVPADIAIAAQDPGATAEVREYTPGHYRIHYRAATPSLLRISNAYFPGWASSSGKVFPVDHALMGTIVPAGEGDISVDFHSTYFWIGAGLTLLALLLCLGVVATR
ncbi:MAG TPA: hypothetical protein VG456_06810 [Candidatus Sulfopaludibacter sp.]|jgi:hypothetical protein|nr:hypothetical protein [Candidatus Sulfopaludibacter sp.]